MPKLKPPPGAAAGAAAVVTWTLFAPKLKLPNVGPELVVPAAAVIDAAADVAAG